MKTFFFALILGIMIGSVATNYFASPNAYKRLKKEKQALLEASDSARFANREQKAAPKEEVGTEEAETPESPTRAESPKPSKAPAPETGQGAEPQADSSEQVAPQEQLEKPPSEAASTPEETRESPQAEEEDSLPPPAGESLSDTVQETLELVAKEARPMVDRGIDLGIAAAVKARLRLDDLLRGQDIDVAVAQRHVTLSGPSLSERSKSKAVDIALHTRGVRSVETAFTASEP